MSQPTVVLVHRAFTDASSWRPVFDLLVADQRRVLAPPNPLRGLAYDAAYLEAVIDQIDGPVLLVGHPYSAGVITVVGAPDKVAGLVYVAGLVPDEMESVTDLQSRFPSLAMGPLLQQRALPDGGIEVSVDPGRFHDVFCPDVPEADAAFLAHSQRPVLATAFDDPAATASWHAKPSWAVFGTADRPVAPELHRFQYARAGCAVTEVEDASHLVMLSRPYVVAHIIRDARAALEIDSRSTVLVGGQTAANIDVSRKLSQALPIFLIVVVGLAFLLLTFAFRTILLPIKAILGFLLSAGAALGAQVTDFQWGWGKNLLHVVPTQTLSFLPIILLAVIFGLSSDYEVFVVSRIKEHYTRTGDARAAVVAGTGRSARVVTAAALITASIFASFLFVPDPLIKSIGFSFAVGVLVDAFVVRLALVPAVMAVAGKGIWYHPRWFERLVPDPDIEGEKLETTLVKEQALDADERPLAAHRQAQNP